MEGGCKNHSNSGAFRRSLMQQKLAQLFVQRMRTSLVGGATRLCLIVFLHRYTRKPLIGNSFGMNPNPAHILTSSVPSKSEMDQLLIRILYVFSCELHRQQLGNGEWRWFSQSSLEVRAIRRGFEAPRDR